MGRLFKGARGEVEEMKLGYLFYWCGWGSLTCAAAFIGLALFTPEGFSGFAIGRIASATVVGLAWLNIGSKKIARPKTTETIEQLTAFQKENCVGARFADEEAMRKSAGNIPWCTRPEPPEYDSRYCYSRERKEGVTA
jgi:hypothetical protein